MMGPSRVEEEGTFRGRWCGDGFCVFLSNVCAWREHLGTW